MSVLELPTGRNSRVYIILVDDVASRIVNREKFYSPPLQGMSKFHAFVDFRQDDVVHAGLTYIGQGQVKPKFQFFVDPYTNPLHMDREEWRAPKENRLEYPNIQSFPTKDGVKLIDWIQGHSFGGFDDGHICIRRTKALVLMLDLDCVPEEESELVYESESTEKRFKSELLQDLLEFCLDAPFHDLTIVVGEGNKQKSFKTHKGLLVTRSQYFRGLYDSGMEDSRHDQLSYEDLDVDAFGSYLKFLYAGVLPFEMTEDLPLEKATNLWVVANRFVAPELERFCEKTIYDLLLLMKANVVLGCLAFAHKYETSLPQLFESSLLYVRGSLRVLRATEDWRKLEQNQPELVDLVLQSESAE